MKNLLEYPFNGLELMKKNKQIKRSLQENEESFLQKNIAILGGSTTSGIKETLELFLLNEKIKPVFYESEYEKYYEDAVFGNNALVDFKPDFIYIHTTLENIKEKPLIVDSPEEIDRKISREFLRLVQIWEALKLKYQAVIIQNNYPLPNERNLGNLEQIDVHGYVYFILELNRKISKYIRENSGIKLNDLFMLSANIGLKNWQDANAWYSYKLAIAYEVIPDLAFNIAKIIKANLGKSKKCLILDLDNTLWGGIISEDGLEKIQIGKETALAEAYTAFQEYILALKQRGVIIAVCSKNDKEIAEKGFLHPDSVLRLEDITIFKANWQEKHLNILAIAEELSIGLDSMVFVDDNPMERQIVRENLPMVIVPEIDAEDISSYIRIIDGAGYFEPDSISADDLIRNRNYNENIKRKEIEQKFLNYEDFLKSLEMEAEIEAFSEIALDRITQLINKTNQFNLTTRRYVYAEIEEIAKNKEYITLYGRLKDKFGEHGIVSILIGKKRDFYLDIDLWVMSCRVLKRDMELAVFDKLIHNLQDVNIKIVRGKYIKNNKNSMVAELYKELGFELIRKDGENTYWEYIIPDVYENKCSNIIVE